MTTTEKKKRRAWFRKAGRGCQWHRNTKAQLPLSWQATAARLQLSPLSCSSGTRCLPFCACLGARVFHYFFSFNCKEILNLQTGKELRQIRENWQQPPSLADSPGSGKPGPATSSNTPGPRQKPHFFFFLFQRRSQGFRGFSTW